MIAFVWPWECRPYWSWLWHSWRTEEPVTSRVYDMERGIRLFGVEVVWHDTRIGSAEEERDG